MTKQRDEKIIEKQPKANDEINTLLLGVQSDRDKWGGKYEQVKNKYESDNVKLSCAFSFGVSETYVKSDKKIMIVGQEAKGHTCDYKKWCLKNWQTWAVDYFNFQVYDKKSSEFKFNTNPSPFWEFVRKLNEAVNPKDAKEKVGICWNNLDKVTLYERKDGKEWKEGFLPYDDKNRSLGDRKTLNEMIFDGKSLLQKEIEIAEADIIVFVVGPSNPYYHTLYSAFLGVDKPYNEICNKDSKKPYPTSTNCCIRIEEIEKCLQQKKPVSVYYTYHPNYLNQSKKLNYVIKQIADDIVAKMN